MARFKDYNYDQMKMIPVSFDKQILPGSFEYSLSYLIDHVLNRLFWKSVAYCFPLGGKFGS